ncbi:MAG: signal peptidase I [Chloroflexi bacterium RBG_16_68_14]|nr:MAG: signal peptidase I [Chloroflexi bacterium RBG_16_68_14]
MDYDRELTGDIPPPPLLEAAFFHSARNDRAGHFGALARSELVRRAARLLSYGLMVFVAGVLLLVATATVPVLFGYHTYTVNGGSMEPSLHAGSTAVAAPTSPLALQVGDVIVRRSSEDGVPVLHRIVEIKEEGGQRLFVTQGDQNLAPDPEPVALQGPGDRVVYSVPYAGYILNFAGNWQGRLLLIGMPLVLLVAPTVRQRWRRPQQQLVAAAEAAPAAGQKASLRVIPIVRADAESYADLPAFLSEQLEQLCGPESKPRTDSQEQGEEPLAA